jgi:hypothetical protein
MTIRQWMLVSVFWSLLMTAGLIFVSLATSAEIQRLEADVRGLTDALAEQVEFNDGVLKAIDLLTEAADVQQTQLNDQGDWIIDLYESLIETREWFLNSDTGASMPDLWRGRESCMRTAGVDFSVLNRACNRFLCEVDPRCTIADS